MLHLRSHKNYLKTLLFAVGLLAATTFVVGAPKALAADCDNNAIIKCGFSSPSDFINKVKANNSLNGHSDLQTVYTHYGLSSGDYTDFAAHAVLGTAYKSNNTIVVNGQTVMTGVKSIGRIASYQGSGYFSTAIGGSTYYGNTNDKAFAASSIPVYVLFNGSGTAQFAVLASCGNPEFGTPVQTAASCKALTASATSGTTNSTKFSFGATSSVVGNAKIVKYVYDFGDGTTQTVTSNFGQTVSHIYKKAGSFTVRVNEYASVPGNSSLALAVVATCTKVVKVTTPPPTPTYSCTALSGVVADKSKNSYSFTATGAYANGAKPSKAVFTFGDGKTATVATASTSTKTTHAYPFAATNKTYTASVTLYFTVNGASKTATSTKCQTKLAVAAPAPLCIQLQPTEIDKNKLLYKFVASARVPAGITLKSGDFTFGDGNTQNGVQADGTTVTATHQFASWSSAYNIAATLHFVAPDGTALTASACTSNLQGPTCKPGVPVGSPSCTPCQYDVSLPADSPQCVPPTPAELPNTGAGDTIAIFAGVIVAGFLVYRQILYRRHKAAFAAAQSGTSPLPLANPLSSQPLQGTPLQRPVRSSFRRRRPF